MNQPADKKLPKHLLLRGTVYYFRLVVPKPLRRFVGGKHEFLKSLKTSDYETALRLCANERERVLPILKEARTKADLGGKSRILSSIKVEETEKPLKPIEPLTVTSKWHAAQLAQQWFLTLEKGGTDWWSNARDNLSLRNRTAILADLWFEEQDIQGGDEALNFHKGYDGSLEVKRFLEHNGLSVAESAEGFALLAAALPEARLEFVRRQRDRIEGKEARVYSLAFRDLTQMSPDLPIINGMTVGNLVSKYIEEITQSGRAPKTVSLHRSTGRLICEIFGENHGVELLGRADVESFARCLETIPPHMKKRYPGMSIKQAIAEAKKRGDTERLGAATLQNRYFSAFALFQYAIVIKALEKNPFDDKLLKQRFTAKGERKERVPFTVEELQAIFRAPLYTGCLNDERGYGKPGPNVIRRGRFWVPLLALYHGMRGNEICQLHTSDVGDWDGGLYLEIRTGEDRRLKNLPSRRTIPVHPELFKFGFKEYVDARRQDVESPRLFPNLTMAESGSYFDNFSKWFSSFLLKVFGTKIKATFHSFRHSFTTACRVADISPQRIDSLCGWAGGGRQQRGYGVAAPVSTLAEDLNRVGFNGLDLFHLHFPKVQEVAITARVRIRAPKTSVSP